MKNHKIALVTGASRGIGRAIACTLGSAGYSIAVNYNKSTDEAKITQKMLNEIGCDSMLIKGDVSDRKFVIQMAKDIFEWGGNINVLINNAGILEQKDFYALTDTDWNKSINVNLNSAFICTQEISKLMNKDSSIINITSIGGQIGGPKAPHYSAAKGALITFTKSSAKLLAPKGIRVNAVSPGFIETEMFSHILKVQALEKNEIESTIPLQRIGTPNEVAEAVEFLSSSRSSYITGQVLNINGGALI